MKDKKQWARQQAARLKTFLDAQGIKLPQKQCLEAVAQMNGSRNWQTFQASDDADVIVRDSAALAKLAQVAVETVLFESLPEGQDIRSLWTALSAAKAAEESGAEFQTVKHKVNQIMEGVEDRDLCVPPLEMPKVITETLAVVTAALKEHIEGEAAEPSLDYALQKLCWDWRKDEEPLPVQDARTYELSVTDHGATSYPVATVNVAYPHKGPEDLPSGSPQLSVVFEINKGLPCAHVYADRYDGEALLSLFAARDGTILVRSDQSCASADSHPLKDKLGLDGNSFVVKQDVR